jgi:hypothetical protein
MAILSQAGSELSEGAETTWELLVTSHRRMLLITGIERPAPHRMIAFAGEEIVRSLWKHRGKVNLLVAGSNPAGPTISPRKLHHEV